MSVRALMGTVGGKVTVGAAAMLLAGTGAAYASGGLGAGGTGKAAASPSPSNFGQEVAHTIVPYCKKQTTMPVGQCVSQFVKLNNPGHRNHTATPSPDVDNDADRDGRGRDVDETPSAHVHATPSPDVDRGQTEREHGSPEPGTEGVGPTGTPRGQDTGLSHRPAH